MAADPEWTLFERNENYVAYEGVAFGKHAYLMLAWYRGVFYKASYVLEADDPEAVRQDVTALYGEGAPSPEGYHWDAGAGFTVDLTTKEADGLTAVTYTNKALARLAEITDGAP